MDDAPVASTAYVGLQDEGVEGGGGTWWLKELIGPEAAERFELIEAKPGYVLAC